MCQATEQALECACPVGTTRSWLVDKQEGTVSWDSVLLLSHQDSSLMLFSTSRFCLQSSSRPLRLLCTFSWLLLLSRAA